MAKLVVLTEGFVGTSCELKAERTTVGRVEDNTFQIAEPSVSSHHCEILLRGSDVVVKDLNSTNGTYVNGQPTTEAVLKPGQILRLGKIEIRFEDETAPPPKKQDHAAPPPGGVKLTELEQGGRPVGSPFAKKSNKANKIFIYVGIGLGLVIVAFIVISLTKLTQ